MLSPQFVYKPNLAETVERHRRLWTRQLPHQILAAVMSVDELPFIDPAVQCPNLESMFNAWDSNYYHRQAILDDHIPVGRVSFGSAAFGGFLGAEVTFEYGIGWAHPFLKNYSQIDELIYNPQNLWIVRQQEACRYFVAHAGGKFPLCETEVLDGLNLVEGLRGSKAYTDIYDYPEGVHRLLEFSSDFNIQILNMQRKILAPSLFYQDGIFSMFRIWLPGETPWMSVDAYGNCSPHIFSEFGSPYLQRMINNYGGGWIHLHSHALHLLPEIVKLDRVVGIGICDDPNTPGGFDQLDSILQVTHDIPLQIDCSAGQLIKAILDHSLPGNIMYMVRDGVSTIDQAKRLMDKVRTYRIVE